MPPLCIYSIKEERSYKRCLMPEERYIQILKVSLPYMHSPLREACRICVRIFEIQQAMHRLDEEEESLEACSKETSQDPLTGLTQSIREFCTPKELEMLDMVTNLAQMARLYREYESEGGSKRNADPV